MPDKRAPSVRARQLAAELRRLRDEARLTGEEVGERLGWSPAKVSRIETARTAITAADLTRLLDLYEVTGQRRDRLTELGRSAGERGWWDAYADTLGPEYATLIAMEAQAERVRWYAAQIVPGLLQTEAYARQIIASTLLISPPGEIERRVQVRMTRQRILHNATHRCVCQWSWTKGCCCAGLAALRSCGNNWSTWPRRRRGRTWTYGCCSTRRGRARQSLGSSPFWNSRS